ncbi:MAG: preprotein translocase subunit SecG [Clostridia bacterium]|nr:preprotein translocase subunit SecG [Clostridia bacterium]
MSYFLGIVIILAALFMIVTVLLQSSNAKGLGAVAGEMETYFGKNKGKTIDAKLALGTKIASVVFVVCCLLFMLVG